MTAGVTVPWDTAGGFTPLWRLYSRLATGDGERAAHADHLAFSQDARAAHRVLAEAIRPANCLDDLLARAADRGEPQAPRAEVAQALGAFLAPLTPPAAVQAALETLAKPGTVAVVSGQQPALLGGPALVLYKALTAIALARSLTRAGQPAVAIFWNASADHDFPEANQVWLPELPDLPAGSPGSWRRRRLVRDAGRRPLAAVAYGERDARRVGTWLSECLPASLAAALTPRSAETFGGWQTRALTEVLGARGLIVLEPHVLRPFAAPVFVHALTEHAASDAALSRRSEQLAQALAALVPGAELAQAYVPQAHALAFIIDAAGERRRLLPAPGGGWRIDAQDPQGAAGDRDHWATFAREHPERLSANVYLRPVFQDYCLPAVAYVAGPSELAYDALLGPLAQALGVVPAALVRRASASVVADPGAAAGALAERATLLARAPDVRAATASALAALDSAHADWRSALGARLAPWRQTDARLHQNLRRRLRLAGERLADSPLDFVDAPALRAVAETVFVAGALQERRMPWLWLLGRLAQAPQAAPAAPLSEAANRLAAAGPFAEPFADGHALIGI